MTKDIIDELHGAADRAGLVCTKTGNFRAAMIDSAHLRAAADEIERLRAERDEARRERDEARRMYCEEAFCHRFDERRFNERCVPSPISNARQIAHNMKWDCFKEASDE